MHTLAPSASPSSSRPARGASSRQTSTAEAFPHVSEDPETRSTPSTSAGASASMSSGCKSGTTCILSGCMTTAKPRRASWLGDADVARAFHLWEGVSPPPVVFAAFPRAARYRAKRSRRQMSLGCNARGSRRAATLGEGSATGAITLSRRGRGFDGALGAVGTSPSTSTCCWSREQLRETERGVRFWERPKRPSGSRVRAHDGELR